MQHQDLERVQSVSSLPSRSSHSPQRTDVAYLSFSVDVFNTLPIASVVASKIFCVHGGLSPSMTSMDDIRKIQRPTDVPDYGLVRVSPCLLLVRGFPPPQLTSSHPRQLAERSAVE